MKTGIRFFKLKFKRHLPTAQFDEHLLRDLGLSRVLVVFSESW
jgi:hypothetical protein